MYSRYFNRYGTKYNNAKIEYDGEKFDSMLELTYYKYLLLLKEAKVVKKIERQPTYELIPAFDKNGKHYRAIKYTPDFRVTYYNKDKEPKRESDKKKDEYIEIVEVKGFPDTAFKIRVRLFEYLYKDANLVIINSRNIKEYVGGVL